MKNILSYCCRPAALILVLALLFAGCQKLTEDPKGSLTPQSFYKTLDDLNAAVTGVYYPLISGSWSDFASSTIWAPLMGSDDITTQPQDEGFAESDRFIVSNTNTQLSSTGWTYPYKVVYAANTVLAGAVTVTKGSKEAIGADLGQVRFLRAWAYFWIVRLYGNIPLDTTGKLDYTLNKAPVKDVYSLIISDLQYAVGNLPLSWDNQPGRPTSWTAKALLAEVYLTMGGWPVKDASKYAAAASLERDVIDNGPYVLLPHFADVFKIANRNAGDIVWAIECGAFPQYIPPYLNSQPGAATDPVEESGWQDMFAEVGFYKRFPPGPRKDATFHTRLADGTPWTDWSIHHPFYAKYRDGTVKNSADYQYDFWASLNVVFIRFDKVLLTYAEARDMANGGPDASAYEAINEVRRRAMDLPVHTPAPGVDLQPGLSQAAFRDSVIAERGWEFAGEYTRWFDLIRTEKLEEMTALKDPLDMTPLKPVSHDDYLMPIPYAETVMDPKLK